MSKQDKINAFNPNSAAESEQLFGLPFTEEESEIIVVPVPWEVTVSYTAGTALGPEDIFLASKQVDLYDPNLENAWQRGIFMQDINEDILTMNDYLREKAEDIIINIEDGEEIDVVALKEINETTEKLNNWVKKKILKIIEQNKIPVLLGGDHSTPYGMIEALNETYSDFGILQIDAHADLREAYEGFTYSHASIMYNILGFENLSQLTQVGIRDFCEDELKIIKSNSKISTFFDFDLAKKEFEGTNWKSICNEIIKTLPKKVYISFDIDGLSPDYCKSTGTPVPGGLSFNKVLYLFEQLVESGREIIAFDIVEVAPGEDEYEANVAARLLYKMSNLTLKSQGK